jgi:hypothetical protein
MAFEKLTFHKVPEVTTLTEAQESLVSVLRGSLRLFVMHETPEDFFNSLSPENLATLGGEEFRIDPYTARVSNPPLDRDHMPKELKLHADGSPRRGGPKVRAVHLHETDEGEADALFIPLRRDPQLNITDYLSLKDGTVDPDVFKPDCYRVRLRPRSKVVFAADGVEPLAHCFTTVPAGTRRFGHVTIAQHTSVSRY